LAGLKTRLLTREVWITLVRPYFQDFPGRKVPWGKGLKDHSQVWKGGFGQEGLWRKVRFNIASYRQIGITAVWS